MNRPRFGSAASAINWRYALGEIALIVVGIVIALQASAWWDNLAERRLEATYLAQLHHELTLDREQVADALERYRTIERDVDELLEILRTREPYHPEFDALFGKAYGASEFDLSTAAYESLKSYGLALVSGADLRSRIAQGYEETYPKIRRSIEYEARLVLDILRPYFLVHFRDLRFNESATPLDYDALLDSTEFFNLMDYRLQVTRQNHLRVFESSLGEIDALISALEAATPAR